MSGCAASSCATTGTRRKRDAADGHKPAAKPKKGGAVGVVKKPATKKQKGAVDVVELYRAAYRGLSAQDSRAQALRSLKKQFPEETLECCLYPGSYIHVVPSLVFEEVLYVDNFAPRNDHVSKFFATLSVNKSCASGCGSVNDQQRLGIPKTSQIRFKKCDLRSLEPFASEGFDVLVSLSAPEFISSSCARFVRHGGFLLANDDFGDASHAMGQPDTWILVGAFEHGAAAWETRHDVLSTYFCSRKTGGARATAAQCAENAGLALSKRPFKWSKNALAYLFQKTV